MKARNGDAFRALWSGDTSGYDGDHSAADLALCNLLAFWTNRDAASMDRLFRQSGLARAKWDSRRGGSTYGATTIAKAIAHCEEGYRPRRRKSPAQTSPTDALSIDVTRLTDAHAAELLAEQEGASLRYDQHRWA